MHKHTQLYYWQKKYLNFKLTSLKKQYLILDIIAKRDANHKT